MNSNGALLEVKNLYVSIDDNEILKDFFIKYIIYGTIFNLVQF